MNAVVPRNKSTGQCPEINSAGQCLAQYSTALGEPVAQPVAESERLRLGGLAPRAARERHPHHDAAPVGDLPGGSNPIPVIIPQFPVGSVKILTCVPSGQMLVSDGHTGDTPLTGTSLGGGGGVFMLNPSRKGVRLLILRALQRHSRHPPNGRFKYILPLPVSHPYVDGRRRGRGREVGRGHLGDVLDEELDDDVLWASFCQGAAGAVSGKFLSRCLTRKISLNCLTISVVLLSTVTPGMWSSTRFSR